MSGYKLIYFDLRGLGEAIRLLLTDQGLDFEDEKVAFDAWPALKPKMKFGQLPCLMDGGNEIVQSNAILRHLGRKHGLYGASIEEATFVDMMADGIQDLRTAYSRLVYGGSFGPEAKEEFAAKTLHPNLTNLDKALAAYSKGPWFLGGSIAFVDYLAYEMLDVLGQSVPGCLDGYAFLKAHHAAMTARPGVAKRLAERGPDYRVNGNKNV